MKCMPTLCSMNVDIHTSKSGVVQGAYEVGDRLQFYVVNAKLVRLLAQAKHLDRVVPSTAKRKGS